jgi:hypothetical protein
MFIKAEMERSGGMAEEIAEQAIRLPLEATAAGGRISAEEERGMTLTSRPAER